MKQAKLISVGGEPLDSKVSLCIYSPKLDIAAVTELVGCSPSHAHKKGDLSTPKATIPARIGLWSVETPAGISFVDKIQHLLNITTGKISNWKLIAANHDLQLRCAVFLHSWNECFDLDPRLMIQIAERGWKFGLSIYSAGGDEVVDAFLSIPEGKGKMKERVLSGFAVIRQLRAGRARSG